MDPPPCSQEHCPVAGYDRGGSARVWAPHPINISEVAGLDLDDALAVAVEGMHVRWIMVGGPDPEAERALAMYDRHGH
jgi:hypothetical protein